ncbi:MAG: sigma-70 family RNA polymerase sigma factor [Phycisphaeraceae bacterium]|nr:sigma-70 family RNA polymerase sigma factor [Phycisphaeraceae bacterium]
MDGPDQVTEVLRRVSDGDHRAAERLIPLVYDELRRLAAAQMGHERADHTLQATALVNEAYLRMVDQTRASFRDRNHFFAVAATTIRRVLVDHARTKGRAKRGGKRQRVELDASVDWSGSQDLDLLALDESLSRLHDLHPRQARVVELRFFAGLTIQQTAEVLGVGTTTVEDDWAIARAWLRRALEGPP